MDKISAYIIAFNEEDKILDAINSVLWVDEIIVADSFSTDRTAKIAESLGAQVVQIPFSGFGELRNKAMTACHHQWIFSLDSDERCTPEVRDEILQIISSDNPLDVYYIPRKNFFMGRWIKHSGFYPNYRQPQLFRKGLLTYKPEQVHEGFNTASTKPIGYLKHSIWQVPFKNFSEVLYKANSYSTLGADKLYQKGKHAGLAKALIHALWSFIQHYFLKLGVLDGWAGFVIALGNFEGTFYRYAKLCERRSGWTLPESDPVTRN